MCSGRQDVPRPGWMAHLALQPGIVTDGLYGAVEHLLRDAGRPWAVAESAPDACLVGESIGTPDAEDKVGFRRLLRPVLVHLLAHKP